MDEKKVSFTPGSWEKGKPSDAIITTHDIPGDTMDKETKEYYGGHLICESVGTPGDANLIMAAPLMHEALNVIKQYLLDIRPLLVVGDEPLDIISDIDIILAKAEGRSN